MPLTALIAIARETATGEPCATLPVAGRTLVEHQAHRLRAAGAGALLLVAARLPPALAAAVERLRDDGLTVLVAADAHAAAARVPAGGLLLLADGMLPNADALALPAGGPALLVWPDTPEYAGWERIDATARWAGVAWTDAAMLAGTAAMLGEWDLELTLVRRLVADARRVPAPEGAVARIDDAAGSRAVAAALAPRGAGPLARIGDAFLDRIVEHPVPARGVAAAAGASAAIGAVAAGFGPLWLAVPLLLAAAPAERLATRLGQARLAPADAGIHWRWGVWGAIAASLPLFGWRLSGAPGWEPLLLAVATLAFLAALDGETRRGPPGRWSARGEAMLWVGAGFAVLGHGPVGLAVLAAWTAVSFFRLQRRAS